MATLRQLEYLVTIVDEGSFTRAAEQLRITQPGLSHQFQALEREVGGPLLERLPRAVRLTPAGRAMLPHARAALADAERATTAARRAAGVATGELHLATLYSISFGVLPTALGIWRGRYPGVRVRLFEHRRADDLTAAMAAGQADIALGPPPTDWDGPTRYIGTEEFLVVTHTNDPIATSAQASRVRLSDLADREWVHFTPDSGLADILDQACAGAGFHPKTAVRTEQAPAAANYASAGLGPTLVPANTIPPHFAGALLRPDPPVHRQLTAYTRTGPDPIAAAFLEILTDQALLMPAHVRRRLHLPDRATQPRR
ncbi:LysR family transcriptional regulator [Kitasatospora kifunensis]|uniref:DNA-binding transcriptional LysR family regulator n=1 Tax=Kitasatospora kifunensis TaxID=58351 RepID=A0A7W7VZ36_KITKI|nr:LysR family transcriptional regulator [Kitasatospora kifunensis]MBB4928377.1 DNA-binding transcriptional LysR family regulator [Kitasatospora kifunensis]